MKDNFYSDCLSEKALNVLTRLNTVMNHYDFILAGGTALALWIGHRISVDLDFFTKEEFSTEGLFQKIKTAGLVQEIVQEEKGTLTVMIDGVKVSMFHYPYLFLDDVSDINGVKISGILDIASMKVMAIAQRGAKRDFIDLYFIMQNVPFRRITENLIARFGKERVNPVLIGKSLVYFNDAETDPEPEYMTKKKVPWETVKIFFKRNVKQMILDISS